MNRPNSYSLYRNIDTALAQEKNETSIKLLCRSHLFREKRHDTLITHQSIEG